ncbi:MFS transporter [Paenibacillus eucommiae]|uniref:YQGE family putative transporter n=1 Tax=Paenibacillus eucommiae TaxID=1355755 RepID=A0ABS4J0S5_9BACL|nr:MFS transporter [Paenibacillus eucommiae]MBP1993443.1 YQGE family putative transporter [Paenibacillus eucommiae]
MQGQTRMNFSSWLRYRRGQIPPEKRLSRDANLSLTIHTFFQFGASMSNVFLNLYLWRLTQSLQINGAYYMIMYALTPLAFALGGWILKKKDRMVAYRIGIALTAVFYLIVILVQNRLVDYFVWFAVFNALANAFYWVGYLTLMYDVSNEHNRIRYLALNMMYFTAASLAGPALAGLIISQQEGLRGYTIVFSIAFLTFLIAALISMKIKTVRDHHKAYYLKLTGIVMKKNHRWVKSLFGFLVLGLLQGIMLFLPNILLFKVMPREDVVGYLGVIYSSLSILTGFFISKYARANKVRYYLALSTAGFLIGSSFLLGGVTLTTVILFMILYSIFAPLQGNSMTSHYYSLIAQLPLKGQLRVESVVVRELFINIGRVLSIGTLISLAGDLDGHIIPWILLGASLIQVMIIWLVDHKD